MTLTRKLVAAGSVAVAAAVVTVVAVSGGSSKAPAAAVPSPPAPAAVVPAAPATTAPVAPPTAAKPTVRRIPRTVVVRHPATAPVTKPATVVRKPVSVTRPKAVVHTETYEQRGQRVLASLHYNWQRLGYRIVFKPERRGYLGTTDIPTKTVTIWIGHAESDNVLAHTIAHELGHVLDFTRGDLVKHKAYLTLRGLSPLTPWYGCSGCTDYRTPAGDWAEVFAYWLAGPGDFRSKMGPPPSAAQMRAIALLYKG